MKAKTYQTVKVKLTLSKQEALWIRDVMKNPLSDINEEGTIDQIMRIDLFNTLFEVLKGK